MGLCNPRLHQRPPLTPIPGGRDQRARFTERPRRARKSSKQPISRSGVMHVVAARNVHSSSSRLRQRERTFAQTRTRPLSEGGISGPLSFLLRSTDLTPPLTSLVQGHLDAPSIALRPIPDTGAITKYFALALAAGPPEPRVTCASYPENTGWVRAAPTAPAGDRMRGAPLRRSADAAPEARTVLCQC
jgi:hypothetical protein